VAQIDDLAQTFAPNVREIVPFDNLALLTLVDDKQEIEATFTSVYNADFVVAPFVVGVLIHRVANLVQNINDFDAL